MQGETDLTLGKVHAGHPDFYRVADFESAVAALALQLVFGFDENIIIIRDTGNPHQPFNKHFDQFDKKPNAVTLVMMPE